ncbi:MAG: aspartate kinase, partial [Candidatus Obscuribacterales bacterium]|nr:aspartate kinase [Candidatus Obscuribacterales bacterium]
FETIAELFESEKDRKSLETFVDEQLYDLDILYRGVSYLAELTRRSLDMISSFGEILSSKILSAYLNDRGIKTTWLDARTFLITDGAFGKAAPLMETTKSKTSGAVMPEVAAGRVVVTQGFIGATSEGVTTTLGRGGSDYSAAIIGVACDAKEIQIWTDVDGMLTADPRVVPDATIIEQVTFNEASELAYFGAKVLHPLTIKPAIENAIPVRILNSMKPQGKGTVITAQAEQEGAICAIASKKGITALFISSLSMLGTHGYLARVFSIFDRFKTPIDLISTSEVSVSLTIDNTENLESLVEALADLADVSVMQSVAIVSVVGRQFREKTGIAGSVFDALKDTNILMISGGASNINLSFLVAEKDADQAVIKLHDRFFARAGSQSP